MLFDDEEQLEVRHVISLAHHNVSIYSGGDVTPEGELFIKRNAICLARRVGGNEAKVGAPISKPFYLFSENCSAKEDFYFALLRNQEQALGNDVKAPAPMQFDVKNIISLVGKLHSNDDVHTRWLNAMIGRVFLSVYRTKDLENLVREKLTKKISRVNRPSFLSHIAIRDIKTGDSAPHISNPRLKDLNVDGECVVEADVRYTGGFRMEVTAVARIDLGSRFKVREVDLVLAVVLKKLEGHCFFKIKAPPSNRVWFSFQTMPKLEMTIEPIVSSRQITYTLILRQIENRIKEVFAETLVFPFWDDAPFFHTEHKKYRGGIWEGDDAIVRSPDAETIAAQIGDVELVGQYEEKPDILGEGNQFGKSYSVPNIQASPVTGAFNRKVANTAEASPKASSTSVDTTGLTMGGSSQSTSPRISAGALAHSEAVATEEAVTTSNESMSDVLSESVSTESTSQQTQHETPLSTPTQASSSRKKATSIASVSSADTNGSSGRNSGHDIPADVSRQNTASSKESTESHNTRGAVKSMLKSQTGSISRGFFRRSNTGSTDASVSSANSDGTPKRNTLLAVTNAAAQARQWGWNAIQRQKEARNGQGGNEHPQVDLSQPMGRGRPLPPPGVPLPPPEKKSTPVQFPKRKQLPPPLLSERSHASQSSQESGGSSSKGGEDHKPEKRPVPPPPLPKRRHRDSHSEEPTTENVFVVPAPSDSEHSEPASPKVEPRSEHMQATVEDASDDDESLKPTSWGASDLETPRPSVSQPGGISLDGAEEDSYEEPATPITAVPVDVEEESDDGYSGWMDDAAFEADVPPPTTTVEGSEL